MVHCQCRSGVLFDHPCKAAASGRCTSCGRSACPTHLRNTSTGTSCVPCLRHVLRDRQARGQFLFLRDDPHFYWFFSGGSDDATYDQYDYQLFDERGSENEGLNEAWEGS